MAPFLLQKPLRRLPLNADYLENKLRTPIFFFPDLESALNFASENQGFKKSLIFISKSRQSPKQIIMFRVSVILEIAMIWFPI